MVYERLCESVHKKLVAGKCPWCGCEIVCGDAVLQAGIRIADIAAMRKIIEAELEAMDVKITDFMEYSNEEAIPALRALLKSANPASRRVAARLLGQLGRLAKEALPDLSALLQDADPQVREAAAAAIKRIEADEKTDTV
jgi:HEAT repeat protein